MLLSLLGNWYHDLHRRQERSVLGALTACGFGFRFLGFRCLDSMCV